MFVPLVHSYDILGWILDNGSILCLACGGKNPRVCINPIFADSEWDMFPVCDICHERIDACLIFIDD